MYRVRLYHLRPIAIKDYATSTAQSYFTPHMFSPELYDVLQQEAKARYFEFPVVNLKDVQVLLDMDQPIHVEWADDERGAPLLGHCEMYNEYGEDRCPLKAQHCKSCWQTECPNKAEEVYTYKADNVAYLADALLSRCCTQEDKDKLHEFVEYAKKVPMGDGFFYVLFTDWNWD